MHRDAGLFCFLRGLCMLCHRTASNAYYGLFKTRYLGMIWVLWFPLFKRQGGLFLRVKDMFLTLGSCEFTMMRVLQTFHTQPRLF